MLRKRTPNMATEPTIFEKSRVGRIGVQMPVSDVPVSPMTDLLPGVRLRASLAFPELTEGDVMRHYLRLSQKNYCVDKGFYPLGSCTMKYNPKVNDVAVLMPGFSRVHPFQPEETVQGTLQILFDMQNWLTAILGMDAVSLQPAAGAHGELLGLMLIRAYHTHRGEGHRNLILVPTAAHGTNPASAVRCGYKTVPIGTDARGLTDMDDLARQITACGNNLAGMMLTNPNTVGLFEEDILDICRLVHDAGGQMYCDGANMNALVGTACPGDMGFDVMHVNLHKTFSVPHGGGGPGSGPVGVKAHLAPFLPVPVVIRDDEGMYRLNYNLPYTIGKVGPYYGAYLAVVRSWAYIAHFGKQNLHGISEDAVLNANYIRVELGKTLDIAYDRICMHEAVFTLKNLKARTGVKALEVAKRIIDHGYHPPTMYFPLIVPECLMIEPTETESRETIDDFIRAMVQIVDECETDPETVKSAPHTAEVGRIDEAAAARNLDLSWPLGS